MHTPRNFFIQPALGFTSSTQGLTEEVLNQYESCIKQRLPQTMRDLYKIQNGGAVRYAALKDTEDHRFWGGFIPLTIDNSHSKTVLDKLRSQIEFTDHQIVYDEQKYQLDRLIIFGDNDGYSSWCLDYGFDQTTILSVPQVRLISTNEETEAFLPLQPQYRSFENFMENLCIRPRYGERYALGVKTNYSLLEFVTLVQKTKLGKFDWKHKDPNTDIYNLHDWYTVGLPRTTNMSPTQYQTLVNNSPFAEIQQGILDRDEKPFERVVITENKYQAGTYQFQDDADFSLVIWLPYGWTRTSDHRKSFINTFSELPGVSDVAFLLEYPFAS